MNSVLRFSLVYIVFILQNSHLLAQNEADDKLGYTSQRNPFVFSPDENKKYGDHHFMPKHDKVKAYYEDGTFAYFSKTVEVYGAGIYKGHFDRKNGFWLYSWYCKFQDGKSFRDGRYIFLDDLNDVQEQLDAESAATSRQERWETAKSFFKMSPYIIGSLIYLILLGWVTFKMNRGFGPPSNTTINVKTGERDHFGRETYVKESTGDTGGCLTLIWLIDNIGFLFYLGLSRDRVYSENSLPNSFLFILIGVAIVVIIVSANLGRSS